MQNKDKYLPQMLSQLSNDPCHVPDSTVIVADLRLEINYNEAILSPILDKMKDRSNWIFVNMFEEKSKKDIHSRIKQKSLQKLLVTSASSDVAEKKVSFDKAPSFFSVTTGLQEAFAKNLQTPDAKSPGSVF